MLGTSIGDGEYYGLNMKENAGHIHEILLEIDSSDWQVIAMDLEIFLVTIIQEKGRKYWLG